MKLPFKFSFKTEAVSAAMIIISLAAGFYFYSHFPDRVASHWNFQGDVDAYSSRAVGAFAIPCLIIAMYALFIFLPLVDPRKERYESFSNFYNLLRTTMIIFLTIIFLVSGLFNLGYQINVGKIVPILVGLLIILIGNYMGKIKSNWFVGIRTPWTLSSENVWNKTHRLGGVTFIVFGLLIMISPFLPFALGMAAFFIGVIASSIGTIVASYFFYRAEQKSKKNLQ